MNTITHKKNQLLFIIINSLLLATGKFDFDNRRKRVVEGHLVIGMNYNGKQIKEE